MEKFNRAVRRHHAARLKTARQFYWGYGKHLGRQSGQAMPAHQLGRVVQYPQACSCPMCGNQRAIEGRTRAELGGEATLREGLDEVARCDHLDGEA